MNLKRIISKINIFNKYVNIIDNHYHNNLFYILYSIESDVNLIIYDINKFIILNKYIYEGGVTGCFNNDRLYLIIQYGGYTVIRNINLYDMNYVIYPNNIFINRYIKNVLYYINNNLYLCSYNDGYLSIFDVNNNKLNKIKINIINDYSFYQANENIYVKTHHYVYTYDTITNNLKTESCDSLYGFGKIYKISKKCSLTGNLIHNHENNEIIEIDEDDVIKIKYIESSYININANIYHETNRIIDNLYFYDNWIFILSFSINFAKQNCASPDSHNFNTININNNYIILTNSINETKIPLNILEKRSLFFRNMIDVFKDTIEKPSDWNNLKINFEMYDKLSIYIKYINTKEINENEFDDLFEICLFVEDIDLEHLSNYIIDNPSLLDDLNKYFYYLEIFYSHNMIRQYYQLISTYYTIEIIDGNEFKKYLKNTKTSSDPLKFYLDTIEYLVDFKYNTINVK